MLSAVSVRPLLTLHRFITVRANFTVLDQSAPSLIVWGIVPRPTPRECMLDAQNTLLRLTTNEFSHYIGPNTIPVSHSRGDFWPA